MNLRRRCTLQGILCSFLLTLVFFPGCLLSWCLCRYSLLQLAEIRTLSLVFVFFSFLFAWLFLSFELSICVCVCVSCCCFSTFVFVMFLHAAIISTNLSVTQHEQGCPRHNGQSCQLCVRLIGAPYRAHQTDNNKSSIIPTAAAATPTSSLKSCSTTTITTMQKPS